VGGVRAAWGILARREAASYIVGMFTDVAGYTHLSDQDLVATVARLAQSEREATAALVASLVEFEQRRLYLSEGFPSLFAYCTQRLHLSEHAAYHRIEAARAIVRFPVILELMEESALTLTAVGLLRPHLTVENHVEVLKAAKYRGRRAVEELVARLNARPEIKASVRKLPEPRAVALDAACASGVHDRAVAGRPVLPAIALELGEPAVTESSPGPGIAGCGPTAVTVPARMAKPAVVRPIAPARYQVQMTVSAETHAKFRHAQDLLRHAVPDGDPAVIFDRALTLLVQQLERTRCGAKKPEKPKQTAEPAQESRAAANGPSLTKRSRRISAAVRREVWARDGGQCAFVGTAGRCEERGFLECHHQVPFAAGGEATVANVSLRCRSHNNHEAERFFGAGVVPWRAARELGSHRVEARRDRHG
jgi:hypothetical protein